MNTILPLLASAANLLGLQVGGMDMAVIQKSTDAKLIKYHAVGVHKGRESVVFGDYEGKADVHDTVTVEFIWDNRKGEITGPVSIVDGKSTLTNLKSDGTNCGPPELKGPYEEFQTVSHKLISTEQIQITGSRTYPAAMVSNYPGGCSMRAIAGGKVEALLWVNGMSAEALGLPIMKGGPIEVSADRKTFSVKAAGNWLWTYTPTLVQ